MKNIIKTILLTVLAGAITACSSDYFDVNTPSETATFDQLRINDLIGPVLTSTLEAQRSAELTMGNYVQYFVSQGGGAAGETQAAGLWNEVYLEIFPNIKAIKEKAAEANAIHFNAIADIVTAANLGLLTDTYDNIPFSEAALGQDNFLPAFDTQEQIYAEIFTLLDSAISELLQPDNSDTNVSGGGDVVYNGDTDKWLRAAYTLKARYQLHLVNNGTVSPSDVLTTIANGFTSNADDFQTVYNSSENISPWYASEVLARNTGNFHRDIASQLISSMNGDYYPFQSGLLEIDPRLTLFADTDLDPNNDFEMDGDQWKGFVSGGGGLAPDGTDANTFFVEDGFYTSEDSPLMLISYAEAQFIKAEAAFLANGGNETSVGSTTEAYIAYMEGITASMSKYGVDGTGYMADTAVDVGETGLMLNHIMKEKYIHNFLNPETFVDYRRYDFSDSVFVGLTIREEIDPDPDYAGQWFRRATYPASELARNEENVLANQQTPITPVGWDE